MDLLILWKASMSPWSFPLLWIFYIALQNLCGKKKTIFDNKIRSWKAWNIYHIYTWKIALWSGTDIILRPTSTNFKQHTSEWAHWKKIWCSRDVVSLKNLANPLGQTKLLPKYAFSSLKRVHSIKIHTAIFNVTLIHVTQYNPKNQSWMPYFWKDLLNQLIWDCNLVLLWVKSCRFNFGVLTLKFEWLPLFLKLKYRSRFSLDLLIG